MKKSTTLGLAGLAGLVAIAFASQAFATPCSTIQSAAGSLASGATLQGSPVCIADYGLDGTGTGLVNVFSNSTQTSVNGQTVGIFSSGSINPYTSQAQTPLWTVTGSSGSVSDIVLQLSANAGGFTYGIYDPSNPSNQLVLFSPSFGGDAVGTQVTLSTFVNNNLGYNYKATITNGSSGTNTATFSTTDLFGFFLTTPKGTTFYSDPALNQDSGSAYTGGTPHMVAYQGNSSDVLRSIGGLSGGPMGPNEYIMAWEDTVFANSDLDYQDFIVLAESITPVPEPAVLGMFGLGVLLIGGFAALRRRRQG